jgi:hypothetical protein
MVITSAPLSPKSRLSGTPHDGGIQERDNLPIVIASAIPCAKRSRPGQDFFVARNALRNDYDGNEVHGFHTPHCEPVSQGEAIQQTLNSRMTDCRAAPLSTVCCSPLTALTLFLVSASQEKRIPPLPRGTCAIAEKTGSSHQHRPGSPRRADVTLRTSYTCR